MIKKYRPTTPSKRQTSGIVYSSVLTVNEPYKPLTFGFKRAVGRNSFGRITTRHKGSGHKKNYRLIDFKYDKMDIPAVIQTVEYDPFRSGFVALVNYKDGEKRYVLLPEGLKVGQAIVTSEKAEVKVGNRLPLKNIPVGAFVYNIEIHPRAGAKISRSAGNFAELLALDGGYANLRLPSGEVRKINALCFASIGAVSNAEHNLINFGKAGRSRWKGIRPTVRGSAMNPVDHPYGGGEGRQGRGIKRPKTRWGKVTGGRKTRTPKKYSNFFIVSRRPKRLRKK